MLQQQKWRLKTQGRTQLHGLYGFSNPWDCMWVSLLSVLKKKSCEKSRRTWRFQPFIGLCSKRIVGCVKNIPRITTYYTVIFEVISSWSGPLWDQSHEDKDQVLDLSSAFVELFCHVSSTGNWLVHQGCVWRQCFLAFLTRCKWNWSVVPAHAASRGSSSRHNCPPR